MRQTVLGYDHVVIHRRKLSLYIEEYYWPLIQLGVLVLFARVVVHHIYNDERFSAIQYECIYNASMSLCIEENMQKPRRLPHALRKT